MIHFLKKFVPKPLKQLWHLSNACFGALQYGHPSKKLYVIGVTGTSGKSSTVYFLRQILEASGRTVGSLSTIDFYIAGKDKLNDQKMTMLGRRANQRYLREMVDAGCDVAIVETTSEGIVQHRHKFIDYNCVVLTNLYPEHIESHGSFENYKNAKKELFRYASSHRSDVTAVVNADIEQLEEFLSYHYGKKVTFGSKSGDLILREESSTKKGLEFEINGELFSTKLFGEHHAKNVLVAAAIARSLDISWEDIRTAVEQMSNPPGRVEFIPETETLGFKTIVDYAFEPVALNALYELTEVLEPTNIIHVLGATGGGRDTSRRGAAGEIAGKHANTVILTNEDPYDEDPLAIIEDVRKGVMKTGMDEKSIHVIEDRGEAIAKAISIAQKNDLVLITGKGSEQGICIAGGRMIPWDDRAAVRRALHTS